MNGPGPAAVMTCGPAPAVLPGPAASVVNGPAPSAVTGAALLPHPHVFRTEESQP
ncbi:hypothetical protein [Streptomyces sp. NPDC045714]|uniref:hypothetical protein n=1 Tax=Streptomyces sp. NPDC045714 TaxID=3154913 RepID=UPI0033EA28A8